MAEPPVPMLQEEEAGEDGDGEGGVLDEEEGMEATPRAQRLGPAAAAGGEEAGVDDESGAQPDDEAREMNGLQGAVQDGGRGP
jgi:hypothetical protein